MDWVCAIMRKTVCLCALCAVGGALIGHNGGRLQNAPNVILYIAGLAMVNASVAMLGRRKRCANGSGSGARGRRRKRSGS